jgi:hypothetical protein
MEHAAHTPGPIDVTFEVPVERSPAKGGWTYVIWPDSAEYFGTRGPGQGRRDGRRSAGTHVVHAARRRSAQVTRHR